MLYNALPHISMIVIFFCALITPRPSPTSTSLAQFSILSYPTLLEMYGNGVRVAIFFLFASYIASIDNVIADAESRISDTDTEWSLSDQAFQVVEGRFGPFDIDLFASLINAKLDPYVSWFPDPGSWAIDAFTLSWSCFYFYAFPPFILISRVLRKIVDDEATGIFNCSLVALTTVVSHVYASTDFRSSCFTTFSFFTIFSF